MKRLGLIVLLACLMAGCRPNTVADPTAVVDSKSDMADLLQRVRAKLPANWSAEVQAGKANEMADKPCLVVTRRDEVLGRNVYPNEDGSEKKLDPNEIVFTFQAVAYMSPEDYQRNLADNRKKNDARMEFEKKLKGIRFAHMGPQPIPPRAFKPKTEAEKQLVFSYSELWARTEPTPLPDYLYGRRSFRGDLMNNFACEDSKVGEELDRVREAVTAMMQYPEH